MTSERHEWFRRSYPSEPAPWQKPSLRLVGSGCSGPCNQGRVPCPAPDACRAGPETEPEARIVYDREGRAQLRWLKGAIVLAVVLVVVALTGAFR